jgi:glycosyltransferase involved in cell wall biosynthesis
MRRSLRAGWRIFFVVKAKPKILLVSTSDRVGGAEQIALGLLRGYREAGCEAGLAVGTKFSQDPGVREIPRNLFRLSLGEATRRLLANRIRVLPRLTSELSRLADLPNEIARWRGREPFHYPGTRRLLELPDFQPEVVHAHNLHRDYFDLRFLPRLSSRIPVVLTLHDAWLLSGHCAHSLGCERWITGCGQCPDLTLPPALRRDATAFNWQRKRAIFQQSRFYVAAPSRWLLEKVENSILAPAAIESRVIPNGIDLEIFRPGDRAAARARLGLPLQADILLFAASGIRENPWKDYSTLATATAQLGGRRRERPLIFLALGEDSPNEKVGAAEIRFEPFVQDPRRLADFYQAADLYLHAARADTFPTSILEALACETPVVATAAGGIPEQIIDQEMGWLTPPGDAGAMAKAAAELLDDGERRRALAAHAGEVARRRFGRERMVADYLGWFEAILARKREPLPG